MSYMPVGVEKNRKFPRMIKRLLQLHILEYIYKWQDSELGVPPPRNWHSDSGTVSVLHRTVPLAQQLSVMQNARTPEPRLLRLRCAVQHYEWGRPGDDSLVARLSGEAIPDPTRPYAELWMGTHPSAPSSLRDDGGGLLLSEWLARNPEALGPAVSGRWGGDLPFLLKVLVDCQLLTFSSCTLQFCFSNLYYCCDHIKNYTVLAITAGAVRGKGALARGSPRQEAR